MEAIAVEIVSEENNPESRLRHLWKKGESGNPKGRPKGVPNKATLEIKDFCRGVIASKAYRASLRARIKDGSLPAAIESLMWFYAFGKPKETLKLEDGREENLAALLEKLKQIPSETLRAWQVAFLKHQQLLLEAENGEGEE